MLTYIVVGKNDNYAGHFDERLLLTLKYNSKKFQEYNIPYEIIFVEWNPLEDRPLLSHKLVKELENIKCYVVGKDIHDQIAGEYTYMTFMEFFAKNAAIRRANGDAIICTNADVFFGDSIFQAVQNGVKDNVIYRAERHDVKIENINGLSEKDFWAAKYRTHQLGDIAPYTDASGDFTMATKKVYTALTGFDEQQRFAKIHKDSRILFSALLAPESFTFEKIGNIYHIDHGTSVPDTGLGAEYREANGPYEWKYLHYLPYINHRDWGLSHNICYDEETNDNIYNILVQEDKSLHINTDEAKFRGLNQLPPGAKPMMQVKSTVVDILKLIHEDERPPLIEKGQ